MLFGSDWLANFYLGCFLFGLIFTILSMVLSAGHFGGADGHGGHAHGAPDDIHVGGHAHIGHSVGHAIAHGHSAELPHSGLEAHGDADNSNQGGFGWLNLPTVLAFITWFGGVGYLLDRSAGLAAMLSAPLAIVSGFVGATIVFLLLTKVLWPGQGRPLSRAEYQMRGTRARVVSRIGANGGTGEIVYVKGGVRSTLGARSEDGVAIEQGTDVVVMRYERGLAYVLNVDAILNSDAPAAELPPEHPTLPLRDVVPPSERARS